MTNHGKYVCTYWFHSRVTESVECPVSTILKILVKKVQTKKLRWLSPWFVTFDSLYKFYRFFFFNNAVFYCVIQNCIGTTVLVRGCTLGESHYITTVYWFLRHGYRCSQLDGLELRFLGLLLSCPMLEPMNLWGQLHSNNLTTTIHLKVMNYRMKGAECRRFVLELQQYSFRKLKNIPTTPTVC